LLLRKAQRLLGFFELLQAIGTYVLTAETYKFVSGTAKGAGRVVLLQNDFVSLRKYFDRVARVDVESLAKLDWDNDASQIVHLPNDAK
jgi:hypothetical protein